MKIASRSVVCLALSLVGLVSVVSADVLRTVALSGTAAPGTGAEFSDLTGTPVLNNAGQTAFRSRYTGSGADEGIWSEGGGSLALVARQGSGAPGTNANFLVILSDPVLNNAGQTAFQARFSSSTDSGSGIWSEGGGALDLVARTDSSAPGTSVDFLGFRQDLVNNDAGQIAFFGYLDGPGVDGSNGAGIWSEGGGSLALVAREGNIAPGTAAVFYDFGTSRTRPVLNDVGQTAFNAGLTGLFVDSSNDTGIWLERSGSLQLFVREGDVAPGTSVNFSHFLSQPVLNELGQTAFEGRLTGLGVDSSNDSGIWSEGSGSLALIARTGSGTPGTSANFTDLFAPVLNSAGQTAFQGSFSGSTDFGNGIWSEGGGALDLVARTGSSAPGTSANYAGFLGGMVLNGAGQTASRGTLTGAGVNDDNDLGIWAQDSSGEVRLIAREGDLLDVDDGPGIDFRTIRDLGFGFSDSGNEDGRRSGFNDLGQLAFRARFTDGTSGIFVSNLVAVPEPSSLLLALAGLATWPRKK